MTNSDLIARAFEEAGVRWVFGVPSGPVLPSGSATVDFFANAPSGTALDASQQATRDAPDGNVIEMTDVPPFN